MRRLALIAALALPCAARAAAPRAAPTAPAVAASTEGYRADWGVLLAKMFHDVYPEDFRVFFDRDPQRVTPAQPRILVAPADGVVLDLKETADSRTLIISIGLGDVHVQRVPLAGKVKSIRVGGAGHLSTSNHEHFLNVRKDTTVESEIGPYVLTQITGANTRRIQIFVREGEDVAIGQRFGRIILGSTVTLRVPKTVRWRVARFERVYGGETVIGDW